MDLGDVALAFWRLEKWVDSINVARKNAATSSLRLLERFLEENKIEVIDYLGQQYDVGMAIDVIGKDIEANAPEDKLIISETLTPLILTNGEVLKFGQVMLGREVKAIVRNNVAPVYGRSTVILFGCDINRLIADIGRFIKFKILKGRR